MEASDAVIQGCHTWMLREHSQKDVSITLDGYALTMYNHAKQAIKEVVETIPMPSACRRPVSMLPAARDMASNLDLLEPDLGTAVAASPRHLCATESAATFRICSRSRGATR